MKTQAKSQSLVVAWMVLLPAAGCVSSDLKVPANHPAHAAAHPGKLTLTRALHPEHDVQDETATDEGSAHAAHAEHETGGAPSTPATPTTEQGAGATYVCPMHPEIVQKEAGACPICGMKLVPKQAEK